MKRLQAFRLKRFWLLLLLPLAFLLDYAARSSPHFAEWYARTFYSLYSSLFSLLTGLVPFSIGEVALVFLAVWLLIYLTRGICRLIRHKEDRLARTVRFLSVPLLIAVCITFLCVTNYGTNHRRYSFTAISGLDVRESSVEELYDLCVQLTLSANELRENVQEDENGVFQLSANVWETAEKATPCFNALSAVYPTLYTNGRPKPVLASEVMSYLDISGIYCPFTFEANVNVHQNDSAIPFTMCHELAHLSGYMREDEANFIAFLAGACSDDPDFRYSSTFLAMIHTSNALYAADRTLWEQAYDLKSDAVRRDTLANSAYWEQYDTPVAEASNKVNDTYLKANGQEDGIRSYGRMVDLLLAYYRTAE